MASLYFCGVPVSCVNAVSVSRSFLVLKDCQPRSEPPLPFIPGRWDFGPHNARLYKEDDRLRKRVGAWCADDKNKESWLQVDLGKIKFVTAVATQGYSDNHFKLTVWSRFRCILLFIVNLMIPYQVTCCYQSTPSPPLPSTDVYSCLWLTQPLIKLPAITNQHLPLPSLLQMYYCVYGELDTLSSYLLLPINTLPYPQQMYFCVYG